MNHFFYNRLLLVAMAFTAVSCEAFFEDTVDLDPPDHESLLSINLEFSNQDSVAQAFVTISQDIEQTSSDPLPEDLSLDLYHNGQWWQTLQREGERFYKGPLDASVLEEGDTYELQVQTAAFPTAIAFQELLPAVQLDSAAFFPNSQPGGQEEPIHRIVLGWPNSQEARYYSIKVSYVCKDTLSGKVVVDSPIIASSRTDRLEAGRGEWLYAETAEDPALPSAVLETTQSPPACTQGQTCLRIRFAHISEAKYEYEKALNIVLEEINNPFAEPVVVPTNFSEGYGIFSVANEQVVDVEIP